MLLVARIGGHTLHLRSPAEVQEALIALYRVNVALLEEWPERWPRLYDSGVRWQLERDPRSQNGEDWLHLDELYDGRETADCEDIAAARAAELTVLDGIPAVPRVTNVPGGYHIVVQLADGTIEDPSVILGMSRPIDLGRVESGARRGWRAVRGLGRSLWSAAQDMPVIGPAADAADVLGRNVARALRGDDDAIEPDAIIDEDGRTMYRLDEDEDERAALEVGALW